MNPLSYFIIFLFVPVLLGGPALFDLVRNPLSRIHQRLFMAIATVVLGGSIFLSFFFSYSPKADVKVISFPFPTLTMEALNGSWPDYVNPLAPFIMVWNVLFMFSAFLFLVMITRKIIDASSTKSR